MDFPLRIFGYLLYYVRAGESKLAINQDEFKTLPRIVDVSSPQFEDQGPMPFETTLYDANKSPSLTLKLNKDAPATGVKSLMLMIQDSDVPIRKPATHAFVYDIDPTNATFKFGELNYDADQKKFKFGGGILGIQGYFGPRPPPSHGPHKYTFQVFALNATATEKLNSFKSKVSWGNALEAVKGNVVGIGSLVGIYETP
ncbi:uncharacterized protein PRCAT00002770001 [Priceomyces carsonii]|uniref:uncharacterized protein n=1 Tax=Priceomyces carsonii TaxID=28549 RepID=UPI002EDB8C22|nr:unnamed protein product [Priceomyces carsonii]